MAEKQICQSLLRSIPNTYQKIF